MLLCFGRGGFLHRDPDSVEHRIQFPSLLTSWLLTGVITMRAVPASLVEYWRTLNNFLPVAANPLRSDYFMNAVQIQDYVLKELIDAEDKVGRRLHFQDLHRCLALVCIRFLRVK